MPLPDEQKTNGNGLGPSPGDAADFRAAEAELKVLELGILTARSNFLRQIGVTHEGQRDLWGVFGYPRVLTTRQYVETYARGGIAGRIVDTFPNATWRGEVELIEDEDPDVNTPFEQAWQDLDQRLQIQAKLQRVDKLAGLSTYAVLLIGAPGDLSQELPRVNNAPEKLLYLQPFLGGGGPAAGSTAGSSLRTEAADADCTIAELVTDAKDPRFGLPLTYQLRRTEVASPDFQKPVHWTRIIHIAEGLLSDDVFGQPALERVWNLLQDLEKVTAGGAEAFWLRANQGMHLDIDKDMALPDVSATIEKLKEQADAYKHQLTRWIRTRGVEVQTLGSDVANFTGPADAILTQIAGAKGIPKRVLTGSEMGELASSQDRENFKDQINGRQTGYAGPYIVRPLVDRLVAYGYLPTPAKGPLAYEVKWPHIQVLTEQEKADGAQKWASTNQTQGEPIFTEAEIRDHWYFMAPLTDEQRAEIDERKKANLEMQAEAMAAAAPPDEKPAAKKPLPFKARAAEEAEDAEILRVLEAAILADNEEVVSAIVGITHVGGVRRGLGGQGSGNFGHEGRPGQVGGSAPSAGGTTPASGTTNSGTTTRKKFDPPDTLRGTTLPKFDPARAYVESFLKSRTGLLESRPSAAQAQKLHQVYSAIEAALTDPDIGVEVYAAITGGGSVESFRKRIDDLEAGRAIVHGGTGESPFLKPAPGVPGQPVIKFKAAEGAQRKAIAVLRLIVEALEDPETREFTEQLLRDVAALRTAGGQGSGNFGHAGRPGEVGGSAPSGAAPTSAAPGDASTIEAVGEDSISTPVPHTGTATPLGKGGINGAKKLIAEDGRTYLYKPSASEQWIFGDTVFENHAAGLAERETLASRVAKELQLPHAVEARVGQVPDALGGNGVLMDWVDGASAMPHPLPPDYMEQFPAQDRAQQIVYDAIIGNVDRHDGNFMVKDGALVPIDHGYSFGRTYPMKDAPDDLYPDYDTGTLLPTFGQMRNVAARGMTDAWLSKDQQANLADRVEKIRWPRVLRGSHLSEEEHRALRLRVETVIARLRAGELGKLKQDFVWKEI